MSSAYLTANDMNTIERLLKEVREPGASRNFDRETAAARFLIDNFKRTKTAETDLRTLLAARIKTLDAVADGLTQWDYEGGASAKGARTEVQCIPSPLQRHAPCPGPPDIFRASTGQVRSIR